MTMADLAATRHIQGWTCHEDPKANERSRCQAVRVYEGKEYKLKSSTWQGLKQAIEQMNEKIV